MASSDITVRHYLLDALYKYENPVVSGSLYGIADTSKTFIFNTCNRRTATGSMEGVAVPTDANDIGGLLRLKSATEVEIYNPYKNNANMWRWAFETWEYTGPDGGDNEFIVRGYHEETLSSESATIDVSGMSISDYTKVVPFINGIAYNQTADGADGLTAVAYLTDNNTLVIKRGAGDNGEAQVGVVLVEFTGANWTIHQGSAQSGDDTGTVTLGSSVGSWDNTFIYHQFKANSGNNVDDAIADCSAIYYPSDSTNVAWAFHKDHVDSVGDSIHYIYAIENPAVTVYRKSDTQATANYMEIDFSSQVDPLPDPNATSFMVSRYSSGTGTAYPRGWVGSCYTGKHTFLHCPYAGNTVKSETQLICFTDDSYELSEDYYHGSLLKNVPLKNYWSFQGIYYDFGLGESINAHTNLTSYGFTTAGFKTRGHTYNFFVDGEGSTNLRYMQGCNSAASNFGNHEKRTVGGWVMVDSIQKLQVQVYKEGGGANNIAFLLGFGNKLMVQVDQSTSPSDYVQVYSDFSLETNRPYHVLLTFDAKGVGAKLYIDGKLQSNSFGNPWEGDYLASHTGPLVLGADAPIDVGGPDVTFYTPTRCFYSDWINTDDVLSDDMIKFEVVEKGLPAKVELAVEQGGGETQSDLDNYANTGIDNYPLIFRIPAPTNGGDLTLEADNITIDPNATYHIQWLGTGKLTWKNKNGSNVSVYSSLFGGDVEIITQVNVHIKVVDAKTGSHIENAHVYIPAADVYLVTDSTGEVSFYEYFTIGDAIEIKVRKASEPPYYKATKGTLTISGADNTITIPMIPDN